MSCFNYPKKDMLGFVRVEQPQLRVFTFLQLLKQRVLHSCLGTSLQLFLLALVVYNDDDDKYDDEYDDDDDEEEEDDDDDDDNEDYNDDDDDNGNGDDDQDDDDDNDDDDDDDEDDDDDYDEYDDNDNDDDNGNDDEYDDDDDDLGGVLFHVPVALLALLLLHVAVLLDVHIPAPGRDRYNQHDDAAANDAADDYDDNHDGDDDYVDDDNLDNDDNNDFDDNDNDDDDNGDDDNDKSNDDRNYDDNSTFCGVSSCMTWRTLGGTSPHSQSSTFALEPGVENTNIIVIVRLKTTTTFLQFFTHLQCSWGTCLQLFEQVV